MVNLQSLINEDVCREGIDWFIQASPAGMEYMDSNDALIGMLQRGGLKYWTESAEKGLCRNRCDGLVIKGPITEASVSLDQLSLPGSIIKGMERSSLHFRRCSIDYSTIESSCFFTLCISRSSALESMLRNCNVSRLVLMFNQGRISLDDCDIKDLLVKSCLHHNSCVLFDHCVVRSLDEFSIMQGCVFTDCFMAKSVAEEIEGKGGIVNGRIPLLEEKEST